MQYSFSDVTFTILNLLVEAATLLRPRFWPTNHIRSWASQRSATALDEDSLLHACKDLGKAQEIFANAVRHLRRIKLTIGQPTRCCKNCVTRGSRSRKATSFIWCTLLVRWFHSPTPRPTSWKPKRPSPAHPGGYVPLESLQSPHSGSTEAMPGCDSDGTAANRRQRDATNRPRRGAWRRMKKDIGVGRWSTADE